MISTFYIIPRIGRIAYLNIPKAASTSICIALSRMRHNRVGFEIPSNLLDDGSSEVHGFTPPFAHLENFLMRYPSSYPALPKAIVKFTFVRNPYDRIYSFYQSKIVQRQNPANYYDKFAIKEGCSFENFIRILTSINPEELEHHTVPQSLMICKDDDLLVDFIGKVETIDEDWHFLKKITGFEYSLGRENATINEMAKVYSKETSDLVYEYYKNDFELFGYNRHLEEELCDDKTNVKNNKLYTKHLISADQSKKLKANIVINNDRLASLVNNIASENQSIGDVQTNQNEIFNEIILKNIFTIDTNLQEILKELRELRSFKRNVWDELEICRNFRVNVWERINKMSHGINRIRGEIQSIRIFRKNVWTTFSKYREQMERVWAHIGKMAE